MRSTVGLALVIAGLAALYFAFSSSPVAPPAAKSAPVLPPAASGFAPGAGAGKGAGGGGGSSW